MSEFEVNNNVERNNTQTLCNNTHNARWLMCDCRDDQTRLFATAARLWGNSKSQRDTQAHTTVDTPLVRGAWPRSKHSDRPLDNREPTTLLFTWIMVRPMLVAIFDFAHSTRIDCVCVCMYRYNV